MSADDDYPCAACAAGEQPVQALDNRTDSTYVWSHAQLSGGGWSYFPCRDRLPYDPS